VHDNRGPARVDNVALAPFVSTVLPGLSGEWENDEEEQREDDAYHRSFLGCITANRVFHDTAIPRGLFSTRS
jgi:hypothetical protein